MSPKVNVLLSSARARQGDAIFNAFVPPHLCLPPMYCETRQIL